MKFHFKQYSEKAAKKLAEALKKEALTVQGKQPVGEGTFEVIMSTEDIDRDGEIIKIEGWNTDKFMKNPVLLFGHDYWSMPIGAITELEFVDGKMIGRGVFARTDEAQKARQLYDDGFLKTVSVGFIPRQREGNIITEAELLELSFVPVPSNPEALSLAKKFDDEKKWTLSMKSEDVEEEVTEEVEEEAVEETAEGLKGCFHVLLKHVSTEGEPSAFHKEVYGHLCEKAAKLNYEAPELKGYTQYELDTMFKGVEEAAQAGEFTNNDLLQLKQDVLSLIDARLPVELKGVDVKPIEVEAKAGRTLSKKNLNLVKDAIDALTKLYESANDEGTDGDETDKKEILKAAQDVDKLAEQMIVAIKGMIIKK